MRYQSNHAEVVAEGFGQSAIFSIAGSGKAFKGLLDGAYSRKIEAAIRESATNALDSHRAASVHPDLGPARAGRVDGRLSFHAGPDLRDRIRHT